jgi:hypothetical protein
VVLRKAGRSGTQVAAQHGTSQTNQGQTRRKKEVERAETAGENRRKQRKLYLLEAEHKQRAKTERKQRKLYLLEVERAYIQRAKREKAAGTNRYGKQKDKEDEWGLDVIRKMSGG